MPLFDNYIIVDWSGARRPARGKNSIWIGSSTRTSAGISLSPPENPATREAAAQRVLEFLNACVKTEQRVLIGFDFPYGYPRGFAQALDLKGPLAPWARVWSHFSTAITDNNQNESNHFEVAAGINAAGPARHGPFWGYVRTRAKPNPPAGLKLKKPGFPFNAGKGVSLAEFRHCEKHFNTNRFGQPKSTWQLAYNGGVGSQVLTGLPRLLALKSAAQFNPHSEVWPFETGFTDSPGVNRRPYILHAEIYPSAVAIDAALHKIKDAAQVLTLARHFARLDNQAMLGAALQPAGLTAQQIKECVDEEGWILK